MSNIFMYNISPSLPLKFDFCYFKSHIPLNLLNNPVRMAVFAVDVTRKSAQTLKAPNKNMPYNQ